jgi:replicative DNA helicase
MTVSEKREKIKPLVIKYGDAIKEEVKRKLKCDAFLEPSKSGLYCCPFPGCNSGKGEHKTGALKYFPDTNRIRCNKCGRSADVIELLQIRFNLDYHAALLAGVEEIGLDVEEFVNSLTSGAKNSPKTPLNLPAGKVSTKPENGAENGAQDAGTGQDFTNYYHKCRERLKNTPAALQYFTRRGIDLEVVYKMFIGYDPEADPAGGGHHTPRVIYPCSPGYYVAKSINPETPKEYRQLQNKGGKPCLFNSRAIYQGGPVFICEGVEDCLSFLTAGAAAVSINSTGNYKNIRRQIEQKKPDPDTVFILWLDNDAAGINAESQIIKDLQEVGQAFITLDDKGPYNDPNDTLKGDPELFMDMIEKAQEKARESQQRQPEEVREVATDNQDKEQAQEKQENVLDFDTFINRIQTDAYKPIETGIKWFDNLLGGGILKQSVLLLLAAPAAGKTTLAQQIAQDMAAKKQKVIYLNLEMSREQMLAKGLSSLMAAVPERNAIRKTAAEILQGYKWTEEERRAVLSAAERYRREIDPYLTYNPEECQKTAEGLKEFLTKTGEAAKERGERGPVIVLDYLHLLQAGGNADTQETIKAGLIVLKDYAIKYDSIVLAIAATNRASNAGGITIDSGRDSSAIEFTADYQLSLNYTAIEKPANNDKRLSPGDIKALQQEKPRKMTVSVLKGRLYETGQSVDLLYYSAYNRFYSPGEWIPEPEGGTDPGTPQGAQVRMWGKHRIG